jgi:hypothetical protein
VVLIEDDTKNPGRNRHCPRAPLVVRSASADWPPNGNASSPAPQERLREQPEEDPKLAHLKVFDSIEPCPSCGSKKFSLLFRDGSDMPERQVNERCDDCGDERLGGWQRP